MKGLDLNEAFYREIVAEIMKCDFPGVRYSSALIGWGSEVLGYDDDLSPDHNWGLRFQLFLSPPDNEKYHDAINQAFIEKLPADFLGYPTAFNLFVNPDQNSVRKDENSSHNINIETIEEFFNRYFGLNPFAEISAIDWLTFPEHKLLAVTSGRVFHDGLGELEAIRGKLEYYPKDIWLYILAAQWIKIFEEQAFVGRAGYVGDELGSAVIAARQVKNLMYLCFVMERKYAPYSKWFGTAFARLDCAKKLNPIFEKTLQAKSLKDREKFLAEAYEVVAGLHNALKITPPIEEKSILYFGRPFLVFGDESVVEKLKAAITDEEVRNIKHDLGSINQFIDSNSQLNDVSFCAKLKQLYL